MLEIPVAVARSAANGSVQADEWKAREVVIECDLGVPGRFVVALGAIVSK